jgi:hypothetical protein
MIYMPFMGEDMLKNVVRKMAPPLGRQQNIEWIIH